MSLWDDLLQNAVFNKFHSVHKTFSIVQSYCSIVKHRYLIVIIYSCVI